LDQKKLFFSFNPTKRKSLNSPPDVFALRAAFKILVLFFRRRYIHFNSAKDISLKSKCSWVELQKMPYVLVRESYIHGR